MQIRIRKIFIFFTLLIAILMSGCGKKSDALNINSINDIKDMKLRIGRSQSLDVSERMPVICPDSETVFVEDQNAIMAFDADQIDAYITNEDVAKYIVKASNGKLKVLDEPFDVFEVAFAISNDSDIPNLKEKINDFVKEGRQSGLFEEIYTRWKSDDFDEIMGDIPDVTNPEYKLIVGTVGFNKPLSYYKDNQLTGADIEIASNLAAYLNAELVLQDSDYAGILTGIKTGKYDVLAASMFITEERAKTVIFSDPYYDLNVRMIVKNNSTKTGEGFGFLEGKRAGILTGTPQADMIKRVVDNEDFYYFNNYTDFALALQQNKVDFFVNNSVAFSLMQEEYTDFVSVGEPICTYDVGTIFPKNVDNETLISQYNKYIEEIKADGTLDKLTDYWLNNKKWEKISIVKSGENGILKLATCTSNKPFAMMLDGEYAGFDIAIVNGFCEKYGYGLEINDSDFAGMLSGISNGKYDLAASQIAYTEERAESVIYSDFYYNQKIVVIIRDDSLNVDKDSFVHKFRQGFKKTFIDENRYKLILSGIKVTVIITVFGFLLAIILGALFCAMSMSKWRILRVTADAYSKIMQGTPIVVVLMIIYYIIFAQSNISNILVAIIGFGVVTAANISQIYVGAIRQVNIGEIEAAMSLGFTKTGTFMGITLPQAIRQMLPAMGSQLVGLMKGTSIVGYIAVMDMTKVSDIIRSSTYEAIFPLLSIAFVYFLISTIILLIFDMLVYRMDPANKKREIKGV